MVGGGDTAAEEAMYLAGLCRKVYLIVRRDELRASKVMSGKGCRKHRMWRFYGNTRPKVYWAKMALLKALFWLKTKVRQTKRK